VKGQSTYKLLLHTFRHLGYLFSFLFYITHLHLVIHVAALLHVLQDLVGLLGILEGVPLGDGPAGRGQHVRPVTQLGSGAHAAKYAAADGFGGANTIVVHDGHNETDFLCAIWRKRVQGKERH